MGNMNDAVIIGGGVSGLTCAAFLADAGIDVTVVEASPCIGGLVKENLQGFLGFQISKTPFEIPRDKPSKKIVIWSSDRRVEVESDQPLCYIVKRGPIDSFDTYLYSRAKKLGVHIITGSKIVRSEWVDSQLKRVMDSEGRTYSAQYFVAADGVTSTMRRLADISVLRPKGIAYGVKMKDARVAPLEMHVVLNSKLAPHGYSYMIGYPDGKHASVVVSARVRYLKRTLREYFELLVQSLPGVLEDAKEEHGFSRGVTCNAGNDKVRKGNLLFVGEAGGFQDPLLGFGMSPSICSSKLAANAIIDSLKHRSVSILSQYERNVRSEIIRKEIKWKWNFRRIVIEHMNNEDLRAIIVAVGKQKDLVRKYAQSGSLKGMIRLLPVALGGRPQLARFLLYAPYIWLPFQI